MGFLSRRLERLASTNEKYATLSQPAFDRWAATQTARSLFWSRVALMVVLAAIIAAVGMLAPRLVHEGRLLMIGAETLATVKTASLDKQSVTKSGTQLYRLLVSYEFTAADGKRYTGNAHRNDIQTPIHFTPGEPIKIVYDPRDPSDSTIDHNLRTDVIGLALFLPFLLVVPCGMIAIFFYRIACWRRSLAHHPP